LLAILITELELVLINSRDPIFLRCVNFIYNTSYMVTCIFSYSHYYYLQDKSRSDLLLILYETAFMVDLKRGRSVMLEVPKDWKHVILISGQVICVDTNEIFNAPCIVPRNVK